MADYLKNAWYMAAWEEEIPCEGFLARTLLDEPWLIYRRQDGSGYVMMIDRCPHRFAPLHLGKREGDSVVCGYHGLVFNARGKCIRNPFSDKIPANARVETTRAVAKHEILWFWPGDPERADPDTIPDFAYLAAEGPMPKAGHGRLELEANYELATDNLMDLSHIEFVHTGSFGGGGVIFKGEHSVREDQSGAIWSNWWMPDIPPPPWGTFLPQDAKFDHWLDMRWHAPATMSLEIGIMPHGGDRTASPFPPMIGAHILTPATETSTHYFYTFPKFNGPESEDLTGIAFNDEDKPMLEAVQRSMGNTEFWGRRPVVLQVDAGAIRARRRLQRLIREERGQQLEPEDA